MILKHLLKLVWIYLSLSLFSPAFAFESAVSSFTIPLATGNQDYTIAGFGTPKAAIFFSTWGVGDDSVLVHSMISFGVATEDSGGVIKQWVVCGSGKDNVATTDTNKRATTTQCLMYHYTSLLGEASFQEFINDGVRVNWNDVHTNAPYFTLILFKGATLSVQSGVSALGVEEDSEIDVDAVGFEPDALIVGFHSDAFNDTELVHSHFSLGFAINGSCASGLTQVCGGYHDRNWRATSQSVAEVVNNYVAMSVSELGFPFYVEISGYDADGFSAYVREAACAGDSFGYLALKDTGADFWTGAINPPVATGVTSHTGIGFQPELVIQLPNMHTAVNTIENTTKAGVYSISTFAEPSGCTESSSLLTFEDAQASSDTNRLHSLQAVNVYAEDGTTQEFLANFNGFTADGWTLNYTVVTNAVRREWVGLAIGDTAAPPAAGPSRAPTQMIGPNVTQFVDDATYSMRVITA